MPIRVASINISPGGIPKLPLESAQITFNGIAGDGHNHDKHNTPKQALLFDALGAPGWKGTGASLAAESARDIA
jgi:hypothetical protein